MLKGLLLVLAVLLVLLLLLRVGVLAVYQNGNLTAHLQIWFLWQQVYPRTKKKLPAPEKAVSSQTPAEKPAAWRPTRTQLGQGARELWPVLCKALERTRKRVRISPCEGLLVFGGTQPDQVARQYGRAQALVWAVMPQLEQLLNIPAPDIRLRWDFEAEQTVAEGKLGMSIRIGDVLLIGLCAGLPALRWLLRTKRESKAALAAKATP